MIRADIYMKSKMRTDSRENRRFFLITTSIILQAFYYYLQIDLMGTKNFLISPLLDLYQDAIIECKREIEACKILCYVKFFSSMDYAIFQQVVSFRHNLYIMATSFHLFINTRLKDLFVEKKYWTANFWHLKIENFLTVFGILDKFDASYKLYSDKFSIDCGIRWTC